MLLLCWWLPPLFGVFMDGRRLIALFLVVYWFVALVVPAVLYLVKFVIWVAEIAVLCVAIVVLCAAFAVLYIPVILVKVVHWSLTISPLFHISLRLSL
jgi:hypothetical protein